MKNTIKIERGTTLPRIYALGESKDYTKSIIIEAFEDLDIDLPVSFYYGNENDTDKKLPLTDSNSEAIALTLAAADGIAGVMLKDVICPYLFILVGLPDGVDLPEASGLSATVTDLTAELTATIDANGSATAVAIEWGEGDAFDHVIDIEAAVASNETAKTITDEISELDPLKGYKFRVRMTSSAGEVVTDPVAFHTYIEAEASALGATPTDTTAELTATIDANGSETAVTIEWGAGDAFDQDVVIAEPVAASEEAAVVTTMLTGLTPETAYKFRVKMENGAGETTSAEQAFLTLDEEV